ncbi:hypothetical protein [Burkholderia ubonensis]|uniref:hypothetical protein n=1 Tax=Burkholderia ubonensis TaxID=101571 RepID=UPI000F59A9FA|nr:hypothetical protein [Burkholderia ubonensis]
MSLHGYVAVVALCIPLSICRAREVSAVTITVSGESSDRHDLLTREACRKFTPTVAQLKRFFSRAVPIDGKFVAHDYYSPCHASGTVSFPDGSSGKWRIYSSGTASLTWASSENTVFLYNGRHNGWHDPFACSYGLHDADDEASCYLPGF